MTFKDIKSINEFLNKITNIDFKKRVFPFSNINKAIKLIFENKKDFLKKYKYIHVGGTNGKGSTCECICNLFLYHKINIASFTSPHILKVEERIKYNNKNIKTEYFLNIFNLVYKKTKGIPLIPFEYLFLTFLVYISSIEIDIVVLEVGIGGKNDITNIIPNKEAAVLTYVSYDHMDILGNTLNEIIIEKLGIITKQTKNVFLGDDKNIYSIIKKNDKYNDMSIYKYGEDYTDCYKRREIYVYGNKYQLSELVPYYQYKNISLAIGVFIKVYKNVFKLNPKKNIIQKYVFDFNVPLRFQIIRKNELIDGAHNVTGIINLIKSLKYIFPNKKYIFVYSSMKNKEYTKIIDILNMHGEIILFDFRKYYQRSFKIETLPYKKMYNISKLFNYVNFLDEKYLVIYTGSIYFTSFILKKRQK